MVKTATTWDPERDPLITSESLNLLHKMWEHPRAPLFNLRCGDGLDAFGVAFLKQYAESLRQFPVRPGRPDWLAGFLDQCIQNVPHYRHYSSEWDQIPTTSREDLKNPEQFIPQGQPLDSMTVVATSGTSGNRLRLCTHAIDAATPWVLMEHALAGYGVKLVRGPAGGVALANLTFHSQNFIYANISHAFDGAGFMKLNLQPQYWRQAGDQEAYLDEFQPQVLAGDPLALGELLRLKVSYRPAAIFSSGMQLLEGTRRKLKERFNCPVLDVYSLTECRYLAASDGGPHQLLPNDVFVEILDEQNRPVPPGERGTITLTGGHNPFFPLLRYRTGDVAAMPLETTQLEGLQGRASVAFRDSSGRSFNCIEVTKQLRPLPLLQFALHQRADHSLNFEYLADELDEETLRQSLAQLFGSLPVCLVRRTQAEQTGKKWILFSSDL